MYAVLMLFFMRVLLLDLTNLLKAYTKGVATKVQNTHLNNKLNFHITFIQKYTWNVDKGKYKRGERRESCLPDVCSNNATHSQSGKHLSLTLSLSILWSTSTLPSCKSLWLKTIKLSHYFVFFAQVSCSIFMIDMEGGERVYSREEREKVKLM